MTEDPNVYDFRAEIKKLLDILSKSLYKHKEIFLRELISNSVDALKKIQFILLTNRNVQDPDAELKIEIYFNSDEKTITIRDTGVGMAKQELINDLGTIAGSGTEKFITQLQEMKKEDKKEVDLDIIGQFGIGFYAVFMVANKVKVITKSYNIEEPSYQWESDGSGKFTIESTNKELRGTDVILYLNDESSEFLNQFTIETIIRKYSNFVSFPIYVSELKKGQIPIPGEEKAKEVEKKDEKEEKEEEEKKKPVNETEPLWRKKDKDITEEQYKNFYHYIAQRYDDYLHVINYQAEGTSLRFRSLMYIPETSSRDLFLPESDYGLSLYSRNVMIMKDCKELLPNWMRYVKGVLESEDISLNISRETIQSNVKILKMRDLLAKKFMRDLTSLNNDNQEKYRKFWNEFGDFIKEGIISDQVRQKKLQNLLLFKTSKTKDDELIGLKEYVDRMKENQEEIFYLVGENLDLLRMSPHLGYYEKNDLEVILFDNEIDNFLMMHMKDYMITEGEGDNKEIKTFNFTPIDIAEKTEEEEKEGKEKEKEEEKEQIPQDTQKFLDHVKEILGEKIVDAKISTRLYGNACRLANPPEGPSSSVQRAMRYYTRERFQTKFEIPKKILELNPDHPIIKSLIKLNSTNPEDTKIEPIIEQLFENSLLSEGDLPDPASMVPRITQLIEMLVSKEDNSQKSE